jgi:arginine utilization regulatory protein
MILQALSITRGNVLKASNILKIPRQTLQYKMKKHGIMSEEKEGDYSDTNL